MRYTIGTTTDYDEWFESETRKSQLQIFERLDKIKNEGYFGTKKPVQGVNELKWVGGRRIYYTIIPESNVLLLLGGNKNGQTKDINKAQNILRRYTYET